MNPSAAFIERPVATALLTTAIVLAGAVAFLALPVAPLPQVSYPTINVSASLPGASAEIMASSVATPLERQFGHIAGLNELTSSSSLGNTSISLQFDLSRNIYAAGRDVQAAINAARTYLPTNLPQNPSYRMVNPSEAPILIMSLTSQNYDVTKLYDMASTLLQQKLSQIDGVGEVLVGGGSAPAVRVEADPKKLASYGLTLANVQSVLRLQNSLAPRGWLRNSRVTEAILNNDQISTADEYKPLVAGYHNGTAVRLDDVAEVINSSQDLLRAGYSDGVNSITVIIFPAPGANIISTVENIRAQLPFLRAILAKGVNFTVVLDRSISVKASVNDVEMTLVIAVCLVGLVVFVFLRSPRASMIPMVAVPVSLVGTFAVMYLLGFSIDNLSLMALTISTGFVVDDAIVVMENIARHLGEGKRPMEAALEGAQEIGFTVVSMSLSLIAVFIPILMMSGIVGRLFREFAVTLAAAIVISLAVSLATTPTMCAHFLKEERRRHGRVYRASERFFNGMLGVYRVSLRWALDHPTLMLLVLAFMIALNFAIIVKIPKGFFPLEDTGSIVGSVQGPQDASFRFMKTSLLQMVRIIKAEPSVQHVNAYTGGFGATNGGFIYISLKPLSERKESAMGVIEQLTPQLRRLQAAVFLQPVQDIRIGARVSAALYQYTLQSGNIQDLARWGPMLLARLKTLPELQAVNSDQQNGGLQEFVNYDRISAARLGQTTQGLDQLLYSAFGQSQVSVIYTPLNQYYVVLEAAPKYWESPEGLNAIYLNSGVTTSTAGTATSTTSSATGRTNTASSATSTASSAIAALSATNGNNSPNSANVSVETMAPLLTVSTRRGGSTPLEVNHTGLFPSVTMSFNLRPGVSLSAATAEVNQIEQQLHLPPTINTFFSGTLQAYQQSLSSEPMLIVTALAAVYIVLGILYESLVHPLTILSTLPSASVGAMLALMLFHMDLNVMSLIGIVLLIGIVKKNAIMMIDFALTEERVKGERPSRAIFHACLLRFRPIMMTTMAAIFGALPLAVGTGMGSELRRPLGITIIGGLMLSQLITLYTTPVVYLTLDRWRLRLLGRRGDTYRPGIGEAG
jgi:multidrug efflux pump